MKNHACLFETVKKRTTQPWPPLTRGLSSVARLGERHHKCGILSEILLFLMISPSVSLRLTPPSSEGGEGKACSLTRCKLPNYHSGAFFYCEYMLY